MIMSHLDAVAAAGTVLHTLRARLVTIEDPGRLRKLADSNPAALRARRQAGAALRKAITAVEHTRAEQARAAVASGEVSDAELLKMGVGAPVVLREKFQMDAAATLIRKTMHADGRRRG